MISIPRCVLLRVLAITAALGAGTASYAQGDSRLWDPSQLPETKGTVKQYTLTPRGDVDGLILTDGTEVKLPPHLTGQIVFAVKPGDAVSVRGLRARALPLVDAASVTNFVTGVTVMDNGPPRGPGATTIETTLGGKIAALLHGKRGEVNGALLDSGTVLRLPPPEAERMQMLLQPGQTVAVRGTSLVTPLGTVVDVQAIGNSAEQLTQLDAPPPPRGRPEVGPQGRRAPPPGRGPDEAAPAPPRGPRG
jgi:hypothetical protein